MPLTRDLRKLICRVLIGVLVFAQLAVAAYACPAPAEVHREVSTTAAMADVDTVSNCEEMVSKAVALDHDAANLCVEHCRFGQQSADTAALTQVFTAPPALLYSLPVPLGSPAAANLSFLPHDPVLAAAPPPHAILHCVLRI